MPKTKPKGSGSRSKVGLGDGISDYVEDIIDEFDPSQTEAEDSEWETGSASTSSVDEVATEVLDEDTEQDEPDDHEEITSSEIGIETADLEEPEFGEDGVQTTATDAELEMTDGFDESILEMDRTDEAEAAGEARLLDAWYAEFADPVVAALARRQPALQESFREVVIGKDDRVRVTATTKYPWRTICSLKITARDGSRWIGTGWLVGPRTVMTAGHVVYMHKRGGWASKIEVIPGRNASQQPFGSCVSSSLRSVKGWTKKRKRSHDYGAIILPKNCAYGRRLGYFGFANLGFFSLLGLKANLSGYPGDKPSGTQWWHARRIKFVTPRTLVYNIDTAGGQSGSPVWRLKNGKRHAVGIHTNGSSGGNSATRITKPVFNNIKKWKAQGT